MNQMNLFNTTPQAQTPRVVVSKSIVPVSRLEDWVHRLAEAATEAADAELYELDTDILDIRDEIYSYLP